ncbi:DUF2062 domain-containing protein [Sinorhizobium medicae]|uniref:DUF2062 domain-containing protein n=2 Tax=Sinorhizobium medicae TaxID=110321 RepID=A0A6G1WJE5_9HYPH|nr:DUF2062 domain-containing protein [Sinorhizobium medicae]MQW01411.1 DUF2062 domain-containing protein [Sinorhizobium medicae]MQW69745.1 DUF2062 domain-containing protein [Sinorhizobium medicae]MQX85253.1 DUF2062 domain-containing protein [Sinorhizobium medicae]WQO86864.1 DUF2062 domain-containing protein [Sinorhizobium medicae]
MFRPSRGGRVRLAPAGGFECDHDGIMLFRRRKPVTISERLGAFFWPRKGFTRAPRYIALRVLRLNSSPHAIAVGVAAGAASSLTPFFGLHIVLAVLLASAFSGNLVAAAITTVLANPVTIPVILTASYEIGTMLTQPQAAQAVGGQEIMRMLEHLDLASLWGPVFKPMLIGSLPLAAAGGLIFYPLAFQTARLFQERRRRARAHRLGHPT